jgi:fucose permease
MEKTTRYKSICHSYYLVFGMFGLGLMPALIKNVEETFGFTHARMGLWMGLSSICFSMAALLGGAFYDRWGAGMAMSGVLVLSAVAAVCIAFAPVAGAVVAALLFFNFANGMGSFVNPLVGRFYRRDHARGINLLHAFQGLGRLLGPVVVWLCLLVTGRWQSTFLVAAGAFTVWLVVAFVGFRDLSLHHPVPPAPHPERKGPARRPDLTLLLGLSGFIFYVGCEVVLIIWSPNFLESEAGFPKSQALLALTLLVAGMTATRLILGLIRRVARVKFVICSVAVSIAALLFLTNASSALWLQPAAFLLGASIGGLWPYLMAAVFDYRRHQQGSLTGMVMISGAAGAFLFLAVTGKMADAYGLGKALLIAPVLAVIYAAVYCAFCLVSRNKGDCPCD